MVRRDEEEAKPRSGKAVSSCCASPAGESPVPAGVGAPGSRPQPSGRDPIGRAGRRKGLRIKQARGPQHEVKLAASKEKQSESRAAHFTAKAMLDAPGFGQIRASSLGGVWSAARIEGEVRNTGDPSPPPSSRQGGSYKPKVKSSAVERESEGIIVPKGEAKVLQTKAVRQNAAGGKSPCGERED